ncbi:PspC domain-containing protein [Sphingomonas sp. ID1715]|uniref:PspC domain-containing protein n=1 Tax=Sphingomonas sp. ID1715 TaxID=1656898 RepID=UPI001489BB28|nr:PspC domain-containing protein [Sphingomonas sp. ID1715]NNM77401.1 PspC domain-containing protein [Sphingomonas sp. ID1715]
MSAFRLDRGNAKLMGVCAGVGNATGIDPLLVRLALFMALLILGPITILGYLVTAWAAS